MLTKGQVSALDAVRKGKNVFVTGGGGVGKSYLVTQIVDELQASGKTVLITASTGKAATSDAGKVMKTVLISERYSRNGYVSKEDLEHEVSEMLGGELITTYDRQTAGGGASPFMIVTYANQILLSADFDDIISLDWTHSNTAYVPTVDRWLQNAERKDGESIFSTADRSM